MHLLRPVLLPFRSRHYRDCIFVAGGSYAHNRESSKPHASAQQRDNEVARPSWSLCFAPPPGGTATCQPSRRRAAGASVPSFVLFQALRPPPRRPARLAKSIRADRSPARAASGRQALAAAPAKQKPDVGRDGCRCSRRLSTAPRADGPSHGIVRVSRTSLTSTPSRRSVSVRVSDPLDAIAYPDAATLPRSVLMSCGAAGPSNSPGRRHQRWYCPFAFCSASLGSR
jgi:hypothetical protein